MTFYGTVLEYSKTHCGESSTLHLVLESMRPTIDDAEAYRAEWHGEWEDSRIVQVEVSYSELPGAEASEPRQLELDF